MLFAAIVESDDLRAVINEMDKAFNYSQKVSLSQVSLFPKLSISVYLVFIKMSICEIHFIIADCDVVGNCEKEKASS